MQRGNRGSLSSPNLTLNLNERHLWRDDHFGNWAVETRGIVDQAAVGTSFQKIDAVGPKVSCSGSLGQIYKKRHQSYKQQRVCTRPSTELSGNIIWAPPSPTRIPHSSPFRKKVTRVRNDRQRPLVRSQSAGASRKPRFERQAQHKCSVAPW